MGTKVRSAVVVGLLGLLAACAEQGTPTADGQSTVPPSTTNAVESDAPADAGGCPSGTYQVESITARDSVEVGGQQVRVADVKGLTLEFTAAGTWVLTGENATISVSASGFTASATLEGSATGSYAKSGRGHVFTQQSAEGQITLDQPIAGISSIPMSEFGPSVAPSGTATITCSGTGATIRAENASLELTGGTGATPSGSEPTAAEPTKGEPAPTAINGSGQIGSYSCTGGPVTINGSNNTLTFSGSCKLVNLNGDSNHVTVASAGVVGINGSQNELTWTDSEPEVNDNGRGNTVNHG